MPNPRPSTPDHPTALVSVVTALVGYKHKNQQTTAQAVAMPIDIDAVRRDTPGCHDLVHFNTAGSALRQFHGHSPQRLPRSRGTVGGYEAARIAAEDLASFYTATAARLNCNPGEIAFQSGSSEGWWRAFLAVDPQPGDRVLVGTTEYQAAGFGLIRAASRGARCCGSCFTSLLQHDGRNRRVYRRPHSGHIRQRAADGAQFCAKIVDVRENTLDM